jgi:hypothetical protein
MLEALNTVLLDKIILFFWGEEWYRRNLEEEKSLTNDNPSRNRG